MIFKNKKYFLFLIAYPVASFAMEHFMTLLQASDLECKELYRIMDDCTQKKVPVPKDQKILHRCLRHHSLTALFDQFLAAGANLDEREDYDEHCLHVAAYFGRAKEIDIFFKHVELRAIDPKTYTEVLDDEGETPLFKTLTRCNTPAAKALLSAGADPNRRNSLGLRPLMKCWLDSTYSQKNRLALMALLCDHGAFVSHGIFNLVHRQCDPLSDSCAECIHLSARMRKLIENQAQDLQVLHTIPEHFFSVLPGDLYRMALDYMKCPE